MKDSRAARPLRAQRHSFLAASCGRKQISRQKRSPSLFQVSPQLGAPSCFALRGPTMHCGTIAISMTTGGNTSEVRGQVGVSPHLSRIICSLLKTQITIKKSTPRLSGAPAGGSSDEASSTPGFLQESLILGRRPKFLTKPLTCRCVGEGASGLGRHCA